MDMINADSISQFNTARNYKEVFKALKQTRKIFVPKRKCPGFSEFGIAAYDDNIALLTIDRSPLEGFDMDYIIFDSYDAQKFFNDKLSLFVKKYKLKGITLKVAENKYFRFGIDSENKLTIPN